MLAKIIDKNLLEVYDLTQFDTSAIMHSGQVFRYFEMQGDYFLVVGKNFCKLTQKSDKVQIFCNDSDYFWNYFDLNTDYNDIKSQLSVYKSILPALKIGGGIRILRSEFNEMVISFIISANNNIKRFTKTLNLLAMNFGEKLDTAWLLSSVELYSFPTLSQLLPVTEQQFKAFGAGYRAPYLAKAVSQLLEIDIGEISKLPAIQLDKKLCQIAGVGPKVSACCRLFSDEIHDLSVCPLDTWLKKALTQIPPCDHEVLLNHKYAGVAQQYIFFYLQHLHQTLKNTP